MKVSVKSTLVLVVVVLVFVCSLPSSFSAKVGFRNNDAHERVADAKRATVNATEGTYKHEDENANITGYGGEEQGGGIQVEKGINGGPKGTQGGGGSSLQGRGQGGQCGGYGGAQGGYGRGQGGYGGEQGGYGGGQGNYGGGQGGGYGGSQGQSGGYSGGQGGYGVGQGGYGGGQGGSSGQGGSEGGFVEPKCGELGCCYHKYGKCLKVLRTLVGSTW